MNLSIALVRSLSVSKGEVLQLSRLSRDARSSLCVLMYSKGREACTPVLPNNKWDRCFNSSCKQRNRVDVYSNHCCCEVCTRDIVKYVLYTWHHLYTLNGRVSLSESTKVSNIRDLPNNAMISATNVYLRLGKLS